MKLNGNITKQIIDYTGQKSGYYRQVERFVSALKNNDQSLVLSSYADAVKTLAVTIPANRSIVAGSLEIV